MKAKIFILGLCALGLVLTACTEKEIAVVTPLDSSDVEISLSAALQSDVTTKSMESESLPIGESGLFLSTLVTENNSNPLLGIGTRATEVTGFDPEGVDGTYSTFAVYSYLHSDAWASATDAVPFINGLTTVSNGDYWTFEDKVFWPVNAENMTFFSYAPATKDVVPFTTGEEDECGAYIDYIDPAIDANTGVCSVKGLADQYDLLVATTADVAKTNNAVPLNFKHAFTAVQFKCGDMPACTVTKLEISDIKYSGVYDFTAGEWTLDDKTTTYTLIDSDNPLALYGDSGADLVEGSAILADDATLMFLPQQLNGAKLAVTFYFYGMSEADAETYEVSLNTEWVAGEEVTYTLSADQDDILPYLTDDEFKAYALANFDTNGNRCLSHYEASLVTSIKCGYYPDEVASNYPDVEDFTGIEYFTALTSFESNTAVTLDLSKNTELTTLYLGHRNVTTNPDNASPIETLDLSQNTKITTLQAYAFRACDKLTSIVLPSSATTIGNYCFSNCTALTTVDFGSVTTINQYAFEYCSVLANVALPETLTTIGTDAFQYCLALSFVDDQIPDTVTSISTGVFGYSGLVSVIWPAGVTEVPRTTFTNCTSLTTVTLPSTVTSIGQNSLIYCSALSTMTIYASTPPSLNSSALNGAGNFVLYVPEESVDAYDGWSSHVTAIYAIGAN